MAPPLRRTTSSPELRSSFIQTYKQGAWLKVRIRPSESATSPLFFHVQIIKVFLPFTMSPAILVRTASPNLPGMYVLKLYDRLSGVLPRETRSFLEDPHAAPSIVD